MIQKHKLQGLYFEGKKFFTKNLTPGKRFFAESIVKKGGEEFREIDVTRSKLGAALAKKISQIGIKPGDKVLYLGASHGYTPSFVSDIVGEKGFIFALDFAPRVVRELYFLCKKRNNITPILGDANHPEAYLGKVLEVDAIYMDIAQKNQVQIFMKNVNMFLKQGGFAILALKAKSVDVVKNSKKVFKEVKEQLEKEITIVDYRELEPFERDHAFFVCKRK